MYITHQRKSDATACYQCNPSSILGTCWILDEPFLEKRSQVVHVSHKSLIFDHSELEYACCYYYSSRCVPAIEMFLKLTISIILDQELKTLICIVPNLRKEP
mmetsp:Transcript_17011/g.39257  ORF Transcript_17011/g.39257 Transcript_17011/m.39257 type:complete len:102 (-) Transcript_17011:216-521(-)